VHEPDPQSFLGAEALSGHGVAAVVAYAHRADDGHRGIATGRETQPHLGQGEKGIARRDPDVATGGERQCAAEAGALDRRYGRMWHGAHARADVDHGGRGRRVRRAGRRIVMPSLVASAAEMPAGAAQHDGAHRVILCETLERLVQRIEHLLVVGVGRIGPVHGERDDAACAQVRQKFVVHGLVPSSSRDSTRLGSAGRTW